MAWACLVSGMIAFGKDTRRLLVLPPPVRILERACNFDELQLFTYYLACAHSSYRAWELMLMGSIVVLENGVGFERMVRKKLFDCHFFEYVLLVIFHCHHFSNVDFFHKTNIR